MILPLFIFLMMVSVQPTGSRYVVHRFVELPGNRSTAFSPSADGSVVIVDQRGNTVRNFDKSFAVRYTIGGSGVGQTEFDDPIDLAATFLLELFVVDRNNRRIQVFDKRGNYLRTVDERTVRGLNGGLHPRACAVSGRGDLYVIDTDGNRVVTIDPRGEVKDEFGSFGDGAGTLRTPSDIVVTDRDEIVVLDGKRLMFFDLFGNYLGRFPLVPEIEWRRLNVQDRNITVSAADRIAVISSDRSSMDVLQKAEIAGFPNTVNIRDAYVSRLSIVILADSALYICPPVP